MDCLNYQLNNYISNALISSLNVSISHLEYFLFSNCTSDEKNKIMRVETLKLKVY